MGLIDYIGMLLGTRFRLKAKILHDSGVSESYFYDSMPALETSEERRSYLRERIDEYLEKSDSDNYRVDATSGLEGVRVNII